MLKAEVIKQEQRYNMIIENSMDGFLLLECIRDAQNNIVDFKIAYCNAVGRQLARFPDDATGSSLLDILPHLSGAQQYELHKNVVETGESVQFETTFRNEEGEEYGWFIVSLQKMEDGVLSRFIDITEKKQNEEKILKQANLLSSILNASQHSVVALKAVKNENGEITDFRFLKMNDHFARLMNKTEAEMLGSTYLKVLQNSVNYEMFTSEREVLVTGISISKELYYDFNGIKGWFSVSIAPLGADGVVQTIVDISESRKDKDRLSKIINTSNAGIVTLFPLKNEKGAIVDFKIAMVNKAVENFLKIKDESIRLQPIGKILNSYNLTDKFEHLKTTFENNQPQNFDFHLTDGFDHYFNVTIDKLDDELLITLTDFTEIKKLQISLQKTIEELKRSNDSLEEFTSAASHDLKEPIRKISLLLSHLKMRFASTYENDPFKTFEKLEIATKRMTSLIDDLLEYSHITHELPELEDVDLSNSIDKIIDDLEVAIHEKEAIIHIETLPIIRGQSSQIQQLFQNLICNAIKYSHKDISPVISIVYKLQTGNELGFDVPDNLLRKPFHVIDVSDNGIGFEQKDADKIFNVFERLNGNHQFKGSGVGLAIARRVVLNHSGFIQAFGEPEKGATFKVFLPA